MSRLTFTAESLRPIIQHAVDAREHSPIFAQMCDEKHLKKGEKMPDIGYAASDQIDHSTISAALHFSNDEGIYLLSNAKERDLVVVNGRKRSRVSYATGFDPSKNSDVWEDSARAVGSSDFVEALPIEWFLPILEDDNIAAFTLTVTEKDIRPGWLRAKNPKRNKNDA